MSPKTFLDVCLELGRCLEFSESLSCVLPSLSVILPQAYLCIDKALYSKAKSQPTSGCTLSHIHGAEYTIRY